MSATCCFYSLEIEVRFVRKLQRIPIHRGFGLNFHRALGETLTVNQNWSSLFRCSFQSSAAIVIIALGRCNNHRRQSLPQSNFLRIRWISITLPSHSTRSGKSRNRSASPIAELVAVICEAPQCIRKSSRAFKPQTSMHSTFAGRARTGTSARRATN